jgi:hypothetical protein
METGNRLGGKRIGQLADGTVSVCHIGHKFAILDSGRLVAECSAVRLIGRQNLPSMAAILCLAAIPHRESVRNEVGSVPSLIDKHPSL